MQYPENNDHVVAQSTTKSSSTKWIICTVISIAAVMSVVIIALGLGLGLGLGLRKKITSSHSSSNENNLLLPPVVQCTYINSSTCGCAATKPTFVSSRIVNGHTAVPHSWPWAILLYYKGDPLCDGFLITNEHILTAGHCVFGMIMSSLQVYAGIHSRSSSKEQVRSVSQLRIHPNYSPSNFLNDIAILKLSTPVDTSTTTVGICCLPSDDPSLPIRNEAAVIVGWGRTRETDSSSISNTLQQAVVQIQGCLTNSDPNRQFCAGYGGSDSCQGDSGGPLMTNINNLWTCTGIVSFGVGCGNGGYYARVSYYRSFIDKMILTM